MISSFHVCVFTDGKIPKDSINIIELEWVIPPVLYIAMSIFATLGIALALSLFIFNVVFRENR